MSHVALFDPTTLIGQEFRNALDQSELEFSRCSALSLDDEETDTLIDLAGAATRVEMLTDEALRSVDLLVIASHRFAQTAELVKMLSTLEQPPDVLHLAPDTPSDVGPPVVEGINLESIPTPAMVSPSASVVLLSQLACQFDPLGPFSIDATVLQAASVFGQDAMNEVFGQARSLLTFDGNLPTEIFGQQVAFSSSLGARELDQIRVDQLRALLSGHTTVELQTVQTGSFHGIAISGSIRFRSMPVEAKVTAALEALGPSWSTDASGDGVSTIDQADSEVASITLRPGADQLWFWIAADNLVRCSARNAVSAVEAWTVAARS